MIKFVFALVNAFILNAVLTTTVGAQTKVLPWFADVPDVRQVGNTDKTLPDIESGQLSMLSEALSPEYQLQIQSQTIPFGLDMLTRLPLACVSNVIHTPERAKNAYFSVPFSVSLAHQVFYLQDNHAAAAFSSQVSSDDKFDLFYAAQLDNLPSVGVVKGRSYGPEIDQMLKAMEDRLHFQQGQSEVASLLGKLVAGQVDFVIEYPQLAMSYVNRQSPETQLSMVPIDGVKPYITGRIACTRSEQGKALILSINQALRTLGHDERYYSLLRSGFSEQLKGMFTAAYNTVYRTRFPEPEQ